MLNYLLFCCFHCSFLVWLCVLVNKFQAFNAMWKSLPRRHMFGMREATFELKDTNKTKKFKITTQKQEKRSWSWDTKSYKHCTYIKIVRCLSKFVDFIHVVVYFTLKLKLQLSMMWELRSICVCVYVCANIR